MKDYYHVKKLTLKSYTNILCLKKLKMIDPSIVDIESINKNDTKTIFYTTLPIALCLLKHEGKPKFDTVVFILDKFLQQSIDYGFVKIIQELEKGIFHIFYQFRSLETVNNLLNLYKYTIREGGIYNREFCPHIIMVENFFNIINQTKGFKITDNKKRKK